MKRRHFIGCATAGAVATTLSGCDNAPQVPTQQAQCDKAVYKWKMITAWPKSFPGIGVGAERLARLITELSNGEIQVKVYSAGELVPALEIFDAVQGGVAELGHSAAYYWQGKNITFNFFSAIPFGMNNNEMSAWLYEGGGIQLWEELYRPFGLLPMPAGNTGIQMAGWFNKEINSVEDFKGLKMRIPGLGGKVIGKLGGIPVNIPGGELFTAMQTGALDAAEWTSPYNDLALGLYKVAKHYYYPGWHEPGTTLECIVNIEAFEKLPKHLKAVVRAACQVVHDQIANDYMAHNNGALEALVQKHGVQLLRLPDDVLTRLRELSVEVVRDSIAGNPEGEKVYQSYTRFQEQVAAWNKVSNASYFAIR